MRVILHGPQRPTPTIDRTMADLDEHGPVAAVTAGWQERESDVSELDRALGGRVRHLRLYERWHDIAERDPAFGVAEQSRRHRSEEAQATYAIRVQHAIAAIEEVQRRGGDRDVTAEAVADGLETLRAIDRQHLQRGREVDADFWDRWQPHERPVIARHRDEVAREMRASAAVAIAGGHIGELLACLHLFNIAGLLDDRPVIAWSAGAMAVAETVVLFHDHVAHGHRYAEVYRQGLGLAVGVVPLPHARRRLRLEDRSRMALLAQRFAPARLLILDDGERVDLGDGLRRGLGTIVTEDGDVEAA